MYYHKRWVVATCELRKRKSTAHSRRLRIQRPWEPGFDQLLPIHIAVELGQ